MLSYFQEARYTLLRDDPRLRRLRYLNLLKWACAAILVIVLSVIVTLHFLDPHRVRLGATRMPDVAVSEMPTDNFQTVAVVFYGRRDRVAILDCYLKQNLKENGGLLDEVVFITRTGDIEDLEFLDQLIPTSKSYRKFVGEGGFNFGKAWDPRLFERGKMYIKLDDDVVFIDRNTVSELITAKRNHPEYLLVSANNVNSPTLSWVHWHLGAIHPYLPELDPPVETPSHTWRASELPTWKDSALFDRHAWFDPPYQNHRWLPLGPDYNLDGTPATILTYNKVGPGWGNWAIAAQQHYSFFENLEKDELWRYDFGMWDYQYERLSINMIAIWGDDVVDNIPFPRDDEQFLTVTLPKKMGRHAVIKGNAMAAHFCFSAQPGVESTDLLSRYKAYAEENVCRR